VNDTKSSSRGKFRPVYRLPQPFQVITEEFIVRCALVHKSIAESDSSVEYRISTLKTIPNLVEDAQIGVVVSI
jgi:hypothetical protein